LAVTGESGRNMNITMPHVAQRAPLDWVSNQIRINENKE